MRWLWPGWGRGSEQEGLLAATFLVVWPERGEGARVEAYAVETAGTAFGRSRDRFETVVSWLGGQESAGCTHAELEARLQVEGRELLRQLLQDHLDLRAQRETRLTGVVGADGVARGSAEAGRRRDLATVFGEVQVRRIAYRARGRADLHPADGALNLPEETHSHGLRRLAAVESSRGSFAEAATSVERVTGQGLGNRQVEQLSQRAAVDFDRFYASRPRQLCVAGDVLVLSCDGKGIVMRPEALRKATKRAAGKATTKLVTRLSKGEKRNRKRRSAPSTTPPRRPAPPTTSCPPATSRPSGPAGTNCARQVASRQRRPRRRRGHHGRVRRGEQTRPRSPPDLGRAGRRQHPPNRPRPRRGARPRRAGHHRGRLRARAGVLVAGRLVLLR